MPVRFAKVSDNLYRGGEPSEDDLKMLRDVYGIKQIISLDSVIGNRIHRDCERLGLKHIIFPLTNGADDDIASLKNYLLPVLNSAPTYLHCKHGKDRTGMTVALYRVLYNNWSVEKALGEAHRFGMGMGLDPLTALNYYAIVRDSAKDPSLRRVAHSNIPDNLLPVYELGVGNAKSTQGGMRDESFSVIRDWFAEVSPDEAEAIATGEALTRSGKLLEPVKIDVWPDGTIALRDGRHRVSVAKDFGAKNILTEVRFYDDEAATKSIWRGVLPIESGLDVNNLDDAYEMRPAGNGSIGGLFEAQLSWAPYADPDSGVGLLGSDVNNAISGDRDTPDGIPYVQEGDGTPGAFNAGGHHYTLEPEAGSFHPNDVVLESQF